MNVELTMSDKPLEGLDDKVAMIRGYYERSMARAEVRAYAERAGMSELGRPSIEALFANLKSALRYVPDPVDHEYIKAPWIMIEDIESQGWAAGDCDDFASLAYTLLKMLGVRAKLAVAWYGENKNPTHIWTLAPLKTGAFLNFDLVAPKLGMTKPGAVAILTYA